MRPNLSVEILLIAVVIIGAVILGWRDPAEFIANAWLPAAAIAVIAFRRWWARRNGPGMHP
jgi:hypothetical protein